MFGRKGAHFAALTDRFSEDPSVRSLAIKRYLARVGQLKNLEVLNPFLPIDEQGSVILLAVEGELKVLEDLHRLRDVEWVRALTSENEIRWMLENRPLLEKPSRSWLQNGVGRGSFSKSDK